MLSAAAVLLAVFLVWPRPADPLPGFPRVFLWAWERPENLEFLDPHSTGIAFLARTVCLRDGAVSVRPRFQPLRYPPGAVLMAVVRVEPRDSSLPPVEAASAAIAQAAAISGVRALQVDFDATLSERPFYRRLLADLRARLPQAMPLSMTALTSWCESDNWIAGLPVAEAVPMLFRLGPGERPRREFRPALCRSSAGVSTDEPLHAPPSAPRLYIFNPRPWTSATFQAALREVRQWH
ncbi:MAG TPA: DUF3142 domain-containing protein [Bryobacteraceae bacterium]|nr:DUF3142 domain-containing protein [Bryobacteraceae bacterium]